MLFYLVFLVLFFENIKFDGNTYHPVNSENGMQYYEIPKKNFKKAVKNSLFEFQPNGLHEKISIKLNEELNESEIFFIVKNNYDYKNHINNYYVSHFKSFEEFQQNFENLCAKFIITAPPKYDIYKYKIKVYPNEIPDITNITNSPSKLKQVGEFKFNENGKNKFAIVETPVFFNKKIIYLYSNEENAGKANEDLLYDQQHLVVYHTDDEISDDTRYFHIDIPKNKHLDFSKKYGAVKLNYSPITEEKFEQLKKDLESNEPIDSIESATQTETNEPIEPAAQTETNEPPIEPETQTEFIKITDEEIENENDKITLHILCDIKDANAFLLNGELHFLDPENDKGEKIAEIKLEKNQQIEIEFFVCDEEKNKIRLLPKSKIFKANTAEVSRENCSEFYLLFYNDYDYSGEFFSNKPINYEKTAITELGFGAVFTAGTIICAILLGIGILAPIIAGPLIAVSTILAAVLFGKGGYDKKQIYTPPKENKSQKPETENSEKVNPDIGIDDPIWVQYLQTNGQTPQQNQVQNQGQGLNFDKSDNENGEHKPPTDNDHDVQEK